MPVVRVVNRTKGTLVAERADVAATFFTRLRGLLGRSSLDQGSGLVLRPTNSIHSFFMKFPIDVLFLDRSARVLHVMGDMRPNRISPLVRHAHTVVELPVGAIAASRTATGDQLRLEALQ
jgi:hypothetical protein